MPSWTQLCVKFDSNWIMYDSVTKGKSMYIYIYALNYIVIVGNHHLTLHHILLYLSGYWDINKRLHIDSSKKTSLLNHHHWCHLCVSDCNTLDVKTIFSRSLLVHTAYAAQGCLVICRKEIYTVSDFSNQIRSWNQNLWWEVIKSSVVAVFSKRIFTSRSKKRRLSLSCFFFSISYF